jgi:predicted nucleic acid-binding protein
MRLVIDTCILISALLKDSVTREILLFSSLEFLLPEHALEELENHKDTGKRESCPLLRGVKGYVKSEGNKKGQESTDS